MKLQNPRFYGKAPFAVAVVHGGPGAAGEMAPVARQLSTQQGVLEPLQTATSFTGQINELQGILAAHAAAPVILVGYSWGAWLSYLLAAYHPALVRKLILVSSGPFIDKYVPMLQATRLERLSSTERTEFETLTRALSEPTTQNKDILLARLGALAEKTDAFDPISENAIEKSPNLQGEIYQQVWAAAAELRQSGQLLELGKWIQCPVTAIHGDYDPHPADGVREPLSSVVKNFHFSLLKNCGHTPWRERQARELFFQLLQQELTESS